MKPEVQFVYLETDKCPERDEQDVKWSM